MPVRKFVLLAMMVAIISSGCARPTALVREDGDFASCRAFFPTPPVETVHRIDGRFAGGRVSLLGAARVDADGDLHCALVTPEGMTLLEARWSRGRVTVSRAWPPFDAPELARAVLGDVALLLTPPAGAPSAAGLDAAGRRVCRWSLASGGWVEMDGGADGWRLRRVEQGRVTRVLTAGPPSASGTPATARIEAPGPGGYVLELSLVGNPAPAVKSQ